MKILVIGNGGREHALAWKCAASPRVSEVLVAPGNAGTATEPKVRNVPIDALDLEGLAQLAAQEKVDLTLVGPEGPLVAGVTDLFAARGLACFGPSKAAAQLEGSKAFSKEFLRRHAIPTAAYRTFTRATFDPAWVSAMKPPIVVKASGLAAGKGVVIAATAHEALDAARAMFDGRFGAAGEQLVIEEFLEGEEASFIVIADGKARPADGHVAGPQAPARRRPRAEHRRHGGVLPRAGGDAGGARARDARGDRTHARGARGRRHAVHRVSLRRPHDRR